MAERLVYIFAWLIVCLIRCLPLSVCFLLGQAIGALMWLILPGYRRLARENLTIAFANEMSEADLGRLTFRHFTTLGANVVCAFKMPSLSQAQIQRVAHFENLDVVKRNIALGRPVIMAINHIGNWELYAQIVFQWPEVRSGTIYQALHNKLVDDLVNRDRRRLGLETFDRKKGFQGAIALLRELGVLGVLVDQHAGKSGVWTPFFHRLCSTSPLVATLALRTNAVVIPSAIYTDGFARWRIVMGQEIPWTAHNPEQLTLDLNRNLEEQIRVSPADWFWVHNRWKTPRSFLLNDVKRGIYLPGGAATVNPFRIVARSPNWLGDAVMSVDAVRAFKFGRPDAHLSVLTPAKLAGFWRRVDGVDEVIEIEKEESVFSVARRLRGRFHVAVLFPNSLRSALEVWLAHIPVKVGFKGHYRHWLLDHTIADGKRPPANQPVHQADVYWRIAARCGAEDRPPVSPLWKPNRKERVIGLCPGAEYGSAKRWPVDQFRQLILRLNEEMDCQWVIVGTSADTSVAQKIASGIPNVTDLTGKTSLEDLMDLLSRISVLVTNDTGTMHLADFIGTPLVSIFGSTEPTFTGPRSSRSVVIRQKVECSPCFLRECPIDFRCMEEIPMDKVIQAVKTFLK
jgi:lipopolysaccharide heptosyltransferase II